MSELSNFTSTYGKKVRPVGAKLGDQFIVMPENIKVQDATGSSANSFDEILAAGFPDPDAVPTLSLITGSLTGTYRYYQAFYNEDRDHEGPSVFSADASPSGQGIRVTFNDTNAPADATHRRIYRNQNGGAIYYRVATVAIATGTYDDTASDVAISANATLELDNDRPERMGIVHTHKGYMFGGGDPDHTGGSEWDNRVCWSKLNNPDAWPTVNQTNIEPGLFGIIRAIKSQGDLLMLYKDEATFKWTFSLFPSGVPGLGDGDVRPINYHRGALNPECVVDIEGKHYCLDQKGIWINQGMSNYTDLTDPIRRFWDRINWDAKEWFSATWQDDRIWFFIALDDDTLPHHAFVYDLLAERSNRGVRWSLDRYDFAIVSSHRYWMGNTTAANAHKMKRRWVAVAMDDYGIPHALNYGYTDGVHPWLDCEGEVDSSTTTTVTDSSQTWSTTNNNSETVNVKGLYLRFYGPQAIGEYAGAFRITGVSGGTLTLDNTFSVAPPAGMPFWVGPISEAVYYTGHMDLGDVTRRKRATTLGIEYEPRGVNCRFNVGFSKDRVAAEGVAITDADESGWEATEGDAYVVVDAGGDRDNEGRLGYREIGVMGDASNLLQLIFDASGCNKPVTIHAFGIRSSA